MKIFGCQLDIIWENKPENYQKVRALIQAARPEPGSLLVLPEMFSTGFSMNVESIAEEVTPGTVPFLQELARELGIFVLAGLVTRGSEGLGLNQAVILSPQGEEICRYSKIHPFTLGGESKHYSRGQELCMFEWNGMQVAPYICYDLRFPEIFRDGVKRGAELFVVIANWPAKRQSHWVTLLQARAIENLAYVVGVNRSGTDPNHIYPGRSLIVDPQGKILADGGSSEGVISAEISRSGVSEWRRDFPALSDMHWK